MNFNYIAIHVGNHRFVNHNFCKVFTSAGLSGGAHAREGLSCADLLGTFGDSAAIRANATMVKSASAKRFILIY